MTYLHIADDSPHIPAHDAAGAQKANPSSWRAHPYGSGDLSVTGKGRNGHRERLSLRLRAFPEFSNKWKKLVIGLPSSFQYDVLTTRNGINAIQSLRIDLTIETRLSRVSTSSMLT